ncbi:hypothetical protein HZU73_00562 [Apis mellifera caucasica]|uniref:Uncharacterized protein LOC726446 n=1 Tax=Apis mellifera TaxID=7460 RepID=A0A7M7FY91_APIME|nr:uncharacterized protein LOC726446 [Apis mellifera]KAG6803848.1 hypothetical protein HZU73_00562 [Apis mellifera caucasica]|eukprot:XP_001120565.2 uncharacterized protein LOC726446 [Apis mellifera]
MKTILTIIFSIILISEAKVAPTSTTNSQGTPDVQLSELISQTQANINNLAKQIQEQWNIPDQDTIVKTVKDQSANFVNNIQDYIKNVTEEVKTKTPELERSWNDVKTMLSMVQLFLPETFVFSNKEERKEGKNNGKKFS